MNPAVPLDSTAVMLARLRGGDVAAREALFARFLPILRQWAHRRLPVRGRGVSDTDDMVQVTLIRALGRIDDFEARREGAFLAYLRTILLNAVRDEMRRALRHSQEQLTDGPATGVVASELERLVGREKLDLYEAGLARLTPDKREAVLLKLEFGYSNAQIAEALGKTSVDAARMLVARALVALAEAMDGPGT